MKWLADSETYRETCLRLSKDLSNFKQDLEYIRYVGVDARGPYYVNAFSNAVTFPYVSKNDRIGNPVLHNGKSAGTLRYMWVVEQCLMRWRFKSVIEIGGGYGGQYLVMDELVPGIPYLIVDIYEALELADAYLMANGIEASMTNSLDIVEDPTVDLIISDYALSEFDEELMRYYLDEINSKYIHCACNATGERYERFVDILSEYYGNLEIVPEKPRTSAKENNVIIYGEVVYSNE